MKNTDFATGTDGGKILSGHPLTTEAANAGTPGMLTNAIDKAVTQVRPMSTPLDQISRMGHVRPVASMDVDYYSVDTRKDTSRITALVEEEGGSDTQTVYKVSVGDPELFEPSETVAITVDGSIIFTAYVGARNESSLTLISEASVDVTEVRGAVLVRMGRAATELDVQSPQFSVLPKKRTNYCQIFKMQIEQSSVMKLSHKEIGWDFTDQQEAAVYDMRLGMEKQFLFGNKMKVYDPVKNETVALTEGIWHQAGRDIDVDLDTFNADSLVDMLRAAFTGQGGSRKKVLIAGSDLIAALNRLDSTKVLTAMDQTAVWGIDFSVLQSKFGKLFTVYSEVFDLMGRPGDGIIIDPEYIQKHVFIPFRADKLDLRGSGQRNTEATVLTEASCLTLRYPDAHARINGKKA